MGTAFRQIALISMAIGLTILVGIPVYADNTGEQFTSFAGFNLDRVNFAQVEKKFGSTKLMEAGDAGGYTATICYLTGSGTMYFLSGELGGSDHDVLGFKLSAKKATEPCTALPEAQKSPKFEIAGLHLGMTKTEFEHVLSKDIKWNGESGKAVFEGKRSMTPADIARFPADQQKAIKDGTQQNYYDVDIAVIGSFASGRLVEFEVWKTETY